MNEWVHVCCVNVCKNSTKVRGVKIYTKLCSVFPVQFSCRLVSVGSPGGGSAIMTFSTVPYTSMQWRAVMAASAAPRLVNFA